MTDALVAELRRISKTAFGQTYRLEVMLAVADSEDGFVNLTDLARTIGQPVSSIQAPMRDLIDLGLVSEAPSGDTKRKHYLRNPSASWLWVREMAWAAKVAAAPTPA
jgi:hypothetical protein